MFRKDSKPGVGASTYHNYHQDRVDFLALCTIIKYYLMIVKSNSRRPDVGGFFFDRPAQSTAFGQGLLVAPSYMQFKKSRSF